MYVGSLPAVSNREDWRVAITLVDAETGETIDISECVVTLTVRDFKNKVIAFTASSEGNYITLPEDGTFMWDVPASVMAGLCARQYELGVRIRQDDRTVQLFIGTVDVMEGIDQQ